jgi:hypothetical protein
MARLMTGRGANRPSLVKERVTTAGRRWVARFAGGALLIGVSLVLAGCMHDCSGVGEFSSSQYLGQGSATLDAAQPMAEQRITVRINAAALPAGVPTTATLLIGPGADARPSPSLEPAVGVVEPPAVVPEVTIIRDDTDTVVPSTISWGADIPGFGPTLAAIPIDCPSGEACERTYRVRIAGPSLGAGEHVSASWFVQAKIEWTGIRSACGIPEGARVDVDTTEPRLIAADRSAFAPVVVSEEAGGGLIARHVTVTSEGPVPSAASMRISVLQPTSGEPSAERPRWRQWVRVLSDTTTTPVADMLVGQEPYHPAALRGGTLDVPILGDCPPAEPCRRGYWVVFQNFPVTSRWFGVPLEADLPNVGRFAWTATATSGYADPRDAAPRLGLDVDDVASGLPAEATLTQAADPVTLVTNKVPTALDVTITVPDRRMPANVIDDLAASAVIVNVSGHGVALVTEVQGSGAGPITGFFNGDGSTNLIAHPFDDCPASGPCTATLQLVGTFNVESTGSQDDSAELSWGVELLGAPAGTTITFGPLREIANESGPSVPVVGLGVAGLTFAALALVRWRRRTSR